MRCVGIDTGDGKLLSDDVQTQLLSGEPVSFSIEHEVDPLTDIFGDRDARLGVEQLELLVLFGRDVDGRGDLLPRHDMTMHDHRSWVKDGGGFRRARQRRRT